MLKIEDFTKIKVEQLANKNQFVIHCVDREGNKVICFQSYDSLIAIYDLYKLLINWYKWDYSKTTLKHLKIFINDYTHYEYENKQQFMKLIINDKTIGTFKEWARRKRKNSFVQY